MSKPKIPSRLPDGSQNPEWHKAYGERNREKLKAVSVAWYYQNKHRAHVYYLQKYNNKKQTKSFFTTLAAVAAITKTTTTK